MSLIFYRQIHHEKWWWLGLVTKLYMRCSKISLVRFKNPTIYNIIRWFDGLPGQMTHRPSVWCSKQYFFSWFLLDLGQSKLFIFYFCKFMKNRKMNWNHVCKEFCKKMWKKISETWSTSHLSQQTSVWYCRLSDFKYAVPCLDM